MKLEDIKLGVLLMVHNDRIITHDKYVSYYNKSTDKIQATAHFVTILHGYEKQLNELEPLIKDQKVDLISCIKRLSKDPMIQGEGSEFSDRQTYSIRSKNKLEVVVSNLVNQVDYVVNEAIIGSLNEGDIDSIKQLLLSINEHNIEIGNTTYLFNDLLKTALQFQNIHLHTTNLRWLSLDILKQLYPDSLKVYEDLPREEKIKIDGGRGRKFDESAPQDKIEKKVFELAKLNKFLNKEGKPKPTSIRDEIMKNYPILMGDIGERQLFNRVNKALGNRK
ncbi:MAG: hypothetical protein WD267_10205 [Balneolales bacterium]